MTSSVSYDDLDRWAFSTSDIARALDVRRPVIAGWRAGVQLRPEAAAAAARLLDFCTKLEALGGYEPAVFLGETLVDGFTVTGWHLYLAGREDLLLAYATGDLAAGDCTIEATLDAFDPDWRRHYWTSMKVVSAPDGGLSIVEKTYDDVRAQIGHQA